ncbi:MAG TPA: hypothetical protein VI542_38750, partial [Candidatus Tectomicrobia bacterium]
MTCIAHQYVRFLPCWQPATAWAFQPRIFEMIPLGDFEHFVFAMLDVDVSQNIVDFMLKFPPNQQLF